MVSILVLLFFVLIIGLKVGVLVYMLNRDKKKNIPPIDEDVLDGRM